MNKAIKYGDTNGEMRQIVSPEVQQGTRTYTTTLTRLEERGES